jgi:Zn-dependent protease with chaperone function
MSQDRLFQMVENLAMRAQIPVPRIGIAQVALPNALLSAGVCETGGCALLKGF